MTDTVMLHIDTLGGTISTQWGPITHSTPQRIPGKPGHVEVSHQCLVMVEFFEEVLRDGPVYANDCLCTASIDGDRRFFHAEAENGRWTWLLCPADWDDGGGPDGVLLGIFPD